MAFSTRQMRGLELAAVVLLVGLAGVLRMARPDLTEFKADEARLLTLALEMAEGQFAVRGISSSVGFPNFPMSVWLYALPTAVWPHPYSATLFTGLLNTIAVAGCYWIVRRYWGISAALAATLMLAVSPWAVLFSRKIWAQNLLPLVVTIWGAGALLAFVDSKRALVTVHVVAMAAAIQIHLAAIVLMPATLIYLIIFRRRVDWKWLLVGAGLALLTAAPFLWHLYQREPSLGLGSGVTGGGGGGFSLDSLRLATRLSLGTNLHSLAGPQAYEDFLEGVPDVMAVANLFWGLLILAGIGWAAYRTSADWPKRSSQALLIILTWLLVPVLFFFWSPTPVFIHYFIATLPAQYILAGVFVQATLQMLDRRYRPLGWVVLVTSAVAQVVILIMLLSFVAERATPGGFGTPLGMKLAAVGAARQLLNEGAEEVIVAGYGSEPDVDEFSAEYDALLYDIPRRFVDLSSEALFPATRSAVLIDARIPVNEHNTTDLYLGAAETIDRRLLRAGEGELIIIDLPGGAAPAADHELDPQPLWANFVRLLGYDELVDFNDSLTQWQFQWATADNVDSQTYHIFNHLIDAEGRRITQVDGPAFSGEQWRPGDTVVSRFWLDKPDEMLQPLIMGLGMYRYPDLGNVSLLDEAANPTSEVYEIEFGEQGGEGKGTND